MSLAQLCGYDPYVELTNLKSTKEISDFFCYLCMKTAESNECQKNHETIALQSALDYVEVNYMKDISLESISQYVGYSAKYFSRYFKERTGMTFISYLNTVRLDKAKILLVETDMKVQDVANTVGVENANTFIRLFKQTEGMTPGQYRVLNSNNLM